MFEAYVCGPTVVPVTCALTFRLTREKSMGKKRFSTFVREESESFIGFKCKIAYDFPLLLCIVLWDVTNNFTMPCAMHRTKFNSFSKTTEWLSSGF